ncbi:YeeE/YedE thiosulfate transporter family protein [Wukongibacter baidiensis]|uniref:YeeE/YedE thiosulfate transporter family protein n=1 Tax=Wukongibacter baidiensis TaxID=1723361 RepID=UPI003D7F33E9
MSSSKIQELKAKRQLKRKSKKNQMIYGVIFTGIAGLIYLFFLKNNFVHSMIWILGLLIGFTLQKSRFCFAASFRDPIMVGSASILKAVIIATIISTIGFAAIQYSAVGGNGIISFENVPGQIEPVGIHTALGAIIFGIGMVIAGGCASGTLMRIGEGFKLQLVVLLGFIIGTLLGANHFEFWDRLFIRKSPTIYLPQYIGFHFSVAIQVVVLTILYYIVHRYEKNNSMMSM